MHPYIPIVLGTVLGLTVEVVGYTLGWSGGAIGTIIIVIVGAAIYWMAELMPPGQIFYDK